MAYTSLTGGAYQSRSLIAAAQRCLNLYVENVPFGDVFNRYQGEPTPFAHLPTPGLTIISQAPQDVIRCLYVTTQGDLYAVAGQGIYYVDSTWTWHFVGTFTPTALSHVAYRYTPVSMTDNGTTLLIADGSVDGYTVNLSTRSFARIDAKTQTGWYGADRVDYLDTFFVANKSWENGGASPIFVCSGSEAVTFDPLDFASKVAEGDPLVSVVVLHRIIWLIGTYSTECWYNTGGGGSGSLSNNNFPFEIFPGAFIDRGCAAKYSVAKMNNNLFWLSQDRSGQCIVMMGTNYDAKRISTHAIENTISSYPTISDAVGFCYQQTGHDYYLLSFPSANNDRGATWCFDFTTAHWHERCWIDANGIEHRHRANNAVNAYGSVVCGDWQNSNLYKLDPDNYTDFGGPIKRLRHFPHMLDLQGNRRISYKQFIANMQVGTSTTASTPTTVVQCNFDASDGTLLENFAGNGDIGSTFSRVDTNAEGQIVGDSFVGVGVTGSTSYKVSGTPSIADYAVSFNATPNSYVAVPPVGKETFAIARADASNNGYKAAIHSDGSQYLLELTVMGGSTTSVALGTLASGYYAVRVELSGSGISVAAQRTTDGKWVDVNGTWQGSPATAISIVDTTYASPGNILIGSSW